MHRTHGEGIAVRAVADRAALLPAPARPTYFRFGVSKRTFSYLGYYAWWRMMRWLRRKHPRLTWKQARRRYYGADRISDEGVTLYNPAKMKVERYLFRGAQIGTPFNADVVTTEVRFRHTSHDDVSFVGKVSELLT